MIAAAAGQAVVLGPAIVVRDAPVALEITACFEAMQGLVERAVVDVQWLIGVFIEPEADLETVERADRDGLQHEDIERASDDRELVVGAWWHRYLTSYFLSVKPAGAVPSRTYAAVAPNPTIRLVAGRRMRSTRWP